MLIHNSSPRRGPFLKPIMSGAVPESGNQVSDSVTLAESQAFDRHTSLGYLATLGAGTLLGAASLMMNSDVGVYVAMGVVGGALVGATTSLVSEIFEHGTPRGGC